MTYGTWALTILIIIKTGFCIGVFETVMASQQALVDVVAKFTLKMVRMADED